MFEKGVESMGYEALFEKSFSKHVDLGLIPPEERAQYIADWSEPGGMTAMLNWYRGSKVMVPPPGVTLPLPDWVTGAFPKVEVPTLVIWGMQDKALLPIQLEGLDRLVDDLQIVRIPDAGHFVPWEKPEAVAAALKPFLQGQRAA
jgi:pimeloyl-ACP methyl ester carboxylesterase